jgi:DNA processing protein
VSHAVVVIEAPQRSGALITARIAVEEHGRDAMAVPGPADRLSSAGCNLAIQQGWASLVSSADDVLACLATDWTASQALRSQHAGGASSDASPQ